MKPSTPNEVELSLKEIQTSFEHPTLAEKFPPVLGVEQAAELAQVPVGTIYDWSSQGKLHNCANRFGRKLRIFRDRFVQELFLPSGDPIDE